MQTGKSAETIGSRQRVNKPHPDSISVLQITDCHLRAEADGVLLGMNTRESFERVLAMALCECPGPDLVLMSGDLAQDGSAEAYQYLQEALKVFSCPVVWFPGNHDDLQTMKAVIDGGSELTGDLVTGTWQWIFLDSSSPGHVHGRLGEAEMKRVEAVLDANVQPNVAIALHHHPVSLGSGWLDEIGLKDYRELLALVARYPEVRLLLWGHVHQEYDDTQDKVRLLSTPSTCIQFKPGSADFAVDTEAPGFRHLWMLPDGRVQTEVFRIDPKGLEIDMDSKGY